MTGAYNRLFTLCYNAAHGNYFTNLQKGGWGGPPTPLAQRTSTSESHACTSMTSCGNPGTCRVKCAGEWPLTIVSESNRGSLKVRGCSSSNMDPHSHDHLCGLAPSPIFPCSSKLVGSSSPRFLPPHVHPPLAHLPPLVSAHHLPLGESSAQPRRRWAPSSAMRCDPAPGGRVAQNSPA